MSANLTLSLGWWLVPLAITLAGPLWALPRRRSERRRSSSFWPDGTYAIGSLVRLTVAVIAALTAWLIWSVAR